jgi:hypothetical protein
MQEFNIGDTVKVLQVINGGNRKIGTVDTITEIKDFDGDFGYRVGNGFSNWYGAEELELVTD